MKYRLNAKNSHHLHSPFLYELYQKVLHGGEKPESKQLKQLRQVTQNRTITFADPKTGKKKSKSEKELFRQVTSSHKFSYFLLRLINHLGCKRVLEAGTSLGINTSYLALSKAQKTWTIEGSAPIASLAQERFDQAGLQNILIRVGRVQEVFAQVLEESKPQLVFLDADHRASTIHHYLQCIAQSKEKPTCIIIHDIYWSKDMNSAWQEIIHSPSYSLTIDIFEAGIIFPDYPMEKQHFILKF